MTSTGACHRRAGRLVEHDTLPVPGGEDAEYFEIGDRRFLATVGVRSGSGPYTLDTEAILYERGDNQWTPFQRFPTFAGKQWRFFSIGGRHFLADLTLPGGHVLVDYMKS